MRLWNTYSGDKSATEILQHSHEVLAVAMHPTGRCLAASTLNGEICFWDTQEAALSGVIEVQLLHPALRHDALAMMPRFVLTTPGGVRKQSIIVG